MIEAMVTVEHGGDAVKAETVQMVFLQPEAALREEETADLRFGVVEAAGVPCWMPPAALKARI